MSARRVVVSNGPDGTSRIQVDGEPPRSCELRSLPGMAPALLWTTPPDATIGNSGAADGTPSATWVPAPGGTHLIMVTFPPDSSMASPAFDPMAFGAEMMATLPGLADRMEPDNPGMHTTDTIDYDVVLDGTMVLELDNGQTIELTTHDVVVQHGTRHAWRNQSDRPATMLFVLVGARRVP